jgi:hypothetical protein
VSGLTTANAPAVALLLYGLLQGGRLVHEAGHAFAVGVRAGLHLIRLRLTLLFMGADFPDEALWQATANTRRPTAVAGSVVQAAFGMILLLIARLLWQQWPTIVHETVFLCGVLHIAALANLLPVAQADGHLLFGRAWFSRRPWLSQVPAPGLGLCATGGSHRPALRAGLRSRVSSTVEYSRRLRATPRGARRNAAAGSPHAVHVTPFSNSQHARNAQCGTAPRRKWPRRRCK